MPARLLVALLAAAAAAAIAVVMLTRKEGPPRAGFGPQIVGADPLVFDGSRTTAYERAAAFGLSHVLYAKSPGGVDAAARRTARFRPFVEAAVAGSGLDADTVEAIVLLESAGRPDVIAGDDPVHAAGLTQIVAETATNLLGMGVDLAASRALTRRIGAARRRGDTEALVRLRAERRRVDARFEPAQALAGTVRYLALADRHFGRDDLAVVSYHMGIGNLMGVLRAYAGRPTGAIRTLVREGDLSWARLYFDSSPTRHRAAWRRLIAFGDDSQTYYWRVLAAREIMRLFRDDPTALERLASLHGRGPSAEQVLHPPESTERFASSDELAEAWKGGILRQLPNDPMRLHFRIDPRIGEPARRLGGDPAPYRALRREAVRLLLYLASSVHALSGAERPLTVRQAAYDDAYGRLVAAQGSEAASHSSLHAAGYAFDIIRRYESGAQAAAFQYTLERLGTLGLIAWTRDPRVIHVAVPSQAGTLVTRR